MASNNKPGPINGPFDEAFLQTLMGRLHLQPPSNSHLSQSLHDLLEGFISSSDDDDDEEEPDDQDPNLGNSKTHLAKEEAKLERELIRIVHGGDAIETLKPNSGQSVSVIGHSICVANHEEAGSGYRVWEWHGHLMVFDDEEGFSPEYVYGNYFERLPQKVEVRRGGNSGLRDLIGGGGDRGGAGDRIVHRGTMNSGSRSTQSQSPTLHATLPDSKFQSMDHFGVALDLTLQGPLPKEPSLSERRAVQQRQGRKKNKKQIQAPLI